VNVDPIEGESFATEAIGSTADALAALGKTDHDPDHPDAPDREWLMGLREWLGEDWDPEGFDLEDTRDDFDR